MGDGDRRTFLVTGAAGGIGRQLVDDLVARDARVLATDIDVDALRDRGWPPGQVGVRALDVRDPGAWDAAIDEVCARFGRLDVLVNVAGVLTPVWVHELEVETVHAIVDINFKGVVFGIRAAARRMVEQGAGHIINVASLSALAPIPGLAMYSASKYGVRAFSLAAAQELRAHGVRVSVLCPDAVQTPMLELQEDHDEAALTFSGRVLTPADVSRAILERVLPRAPLEVFLPRGRGWMARFADVFPTIAFSLRPLLERRGRARQRRLRARRK